MTNIKILDEVIDVDRRIKLLNSAIDNIGDASTDQIDYMRRNRDNLLIQKKALQEKVVKIIDQMKYSQQKKILIHRYIDCMSWKCVLKEMMNSDMRSMLKLHNRALKSFSEIVSDVTPEA